MSQVEYKNWFQRMGEAIGGVLFGMVLFVVAFPVLFWNEGRYIHTYYDIEYGRQNLVEASADKVDPANNDKFVHISGMAKTDDILADAAFGVSVGALKLRRTSEIYQWTEIIPPKETRKKLGGGEETVQPPPRYEQKWVSEPIDSGKFKEAAAHPNTGSLTFASNTQTAGKITVGAFVLPSGLVSALNKYGPLPSAGINFEKAEAEVRKSWKPSGEWFYTGDPSSPRIGDQRVAFAVVMPAEVSLIAQQTGDTFRPFPTPNQTQLFHIEYGNDSGAVLLDHLQSGNTSLLWILRGVGLFLMWLGISLVFRPLVVIADVVPFFGNMLQFGVGIFALLLALPFALVTIAIGWIYYRPLIGIALLAAAAAIIGLAVYFGGKRKAAKAQPG